MDALLERTTARIYELLLSRDIKLDTWLIDGIRLEVNSALMSACLIGRTEALREVIRRLNEFKREA